MLIFFHKHTHMQQEADSDDSNLVSERLDMLMPCVALYWEVRYANTCPLDCPLQLTTPYNTKWDMQMRAHGPYQVTG